MRKEMIDRKKGELPLCRQCELLGINRGTLYYTPSVADPKELDLMEKIDKLYLEDPARGTRRMSQALSNLGHKVGRHKVRTLMRLMRLKTVYCRPRTTIMGPAKYKYPYLLRKLPILSPNQAWAVDITYIPMRKGFMYLFAVMDIYSRYIVGWSLSNTMTANWVVSTLKYEKIYIEVPGDGISLNNCCSEYIYYYNNKREHSSLDYAASIAKFGKAA